MKTYITFVSWEDRFLESLYNDIKQHKDIEQIYFFYFKDEKFLTKTQKNIEILDTMVNDSGINIFKVDLDFEDYLYSWKTIATFMEKLIPEDEAILNISTMPRNMIFTMLHFLDKQKVNYEVCYYPPCKHGEDLTRNPSRPQMILQHGGIMYPEKKTALIVILGYDIKRVYQLYNFFEPYILLIGFGTNHHTQLPTEYNTEFEEIPNKKFFNINSFSHEEVFTTLEQIVTRLLKDHNILLCSLGPKIEAIGMYKLHKKYPDTALVYAPSKDYADDYSTGINLEGKTSISSSWLKVD